MKRNWWNRRTWYTTYTSLSLLFYIQDKEHLYYNSNKGVARVEQKEGQHKGVYRKRIKRPKDNKDRMKNKGNGKYNRVL